MGNNIFKGAKFGDDFVDANGNVYRYIQPLECGIHILHLIDRVENTLFNADGISILPFIAPIASRYERPIDEEWMTEKAYYLCPKNSKDKQEWTNGFIEGIKYSLNNNLSRDLQ